MKPIFLISNVAFISWIIHLFTNDFISGAIFSICFGCMYGNIWGKHLENKL